MLNIWVKCLSAVLGAMSFKAFTDTIFSLEQNHLGHFGRVPYEEYACEIILNWGRQNRRCC